MNIKFDTIDLRDGAKAGAQAAVVGAVASAEGALRPLPPVVPEAVIRGGYIPLCVHRVAPGVDNLIVARREPDGTSAIAYVGYSGESTGDIHDGILRHLEPTVIAHVADRFTSGEAIGSVAVLAGSDGLHYLRWHDGAYRNLGSRLPPLTAEFRLVAEDSSAAGREIAIALDSAEQASALASRISVGGAMTLPSGDNSPWLALTDALTDEALATLYSAASAGGYWQPFFVRAAFRLCGGGHAGHTPPMLMLPCGKYPPVVAASGLRVDTSDATLRFTARTSTFVRCRLEMRLLGFDSRQMELWADLIDGIDIAVTPPVATFDPSARVSGIAPLRVIVGSRSAAGQRPGADGVVHIPDGDIPLKGIYAATASEYAAEHHFSSAELDTMAIRFGSVDSDEFTERLTTRGVFHVVERLDRSDLCRFTSGFSATALPPDSPGATAALPAMEDGYRQLNRFVVEGAEGPSGSPMIAFNGRLTIAPAAEIIGEPPFPRALFSVSGSGGTGAGLRGVGLRVVVSLPQGRRETTRAYSGGEVVVAKPDVLGDVSSLAPRWIFYPDPDAVELSVVDDSTGFTATYPLRRHASLNGSYFFGGLGSEPSDVAATDAGGERVAVTAGAVAASLPKLISSGFGEPLILSSINSLMLPHSRVLALRLAVSAMSAGQFGRYPLYFFTDAGVGVADCSAQGEWSAPRLIGGEAAVSASAIVPVEGGVAFLTRRGVRLLTGSSVRVLDATVSWSEPDRLSEIAGIDRFLKACGAAASSSEIATAMPLVPGVASRLACDPERRLLHIYRPDESRLMATCSLATGKWGITVNSIPWRMAFVVGGRLVAYCGDGTLACPDDQAAARGMVTAVSRPVVADDGRRFRIGRVGIVCRGEGSPSDSAVALYGSNDGGAHWFPVAAFRGERSDRLCGSPWRAYIVAVHTRGRIPLSVDIRGRDPI